MTKFEMDQDEFREVFHDNMEWEGVTPDGRYVRVSNEQIDERRWVSVHKTVFHDTVANKFYRYGYEEPLTEQQEGSEREPDVSEVVEVFPEEVVKTVYFSEEELSKRKP